MALTSPSYAQCYAMGRNDEAVLRGAVGAEDDGAMVIIHILLSSNNVVWQGQRGNLVHLP